MSQLRGLMVLLSNMLRLPIRVYENKTLTEDFQFSGAIDGYDSL